MKQSVFDQRNRYNGFNRRCQSVKSDYFTQQWGCCATAAILHICMKQIPLRNRAKEVIAYALVDDLDYERINQWRWCLHNKGYANRQRSRKLGKLTLIMMHRVVLEAPDGIEVDHRNGNKLDNRRENLRLATPAENRRNRLIPKNNKCGFKGVYLYHNGKYKAQIAFNGKRYALGYFSTAQEASAAYMKAASAMHGEFASLGLSSV